MAFAKKQAPAPRISAERLAAIAGGGVGAVEAVEDAVASEPRRMVAPDLSRIRPRGIEETPDQRKKRLTVKTINFTATIIARFAIMAGLGLFIWSGYEMTATIHRGAACGIVLIFADLGRVIIKAMEPGTK